MGLQDPAGERPRAPRLELGGDGGRHAQDRRYPVGGQGFDLAQPESSTPPLREAAESRFYDNGVGALGPGSGCFAGPGGRGRRHGHTGRATGPPVSGVFHRTAVHRRQQDRTEAHVAVKLVPARPSQRPAKAVAHRGHGRITVEGDGLRQAPGHLAVTAEQLGKRLGFASRRQTDQLAFSAECRCCCGCGKSDRIHNHL